MKRTLLEIYLSIRYLKRRKIPLYEKFIPFVFLKQGIEIGGPSDIFRKKLPVYRYLKDLDGVNFSDSTIWEGKINSHDGYKFYKNKIGKQFISDGTSLGEIKSEKYDFVLSSNCLEHIANPLKALFEWKRILKEDGALILILPNRFSNFDHLRPVTPMDHLVRDFEENMSEDDLTHLDEILSLHDLSMDPAAGDLGQFKERCQKNASNRALHHHVFDLELMRQMCTYIGLQVMHTTETDQDHFILAVKKES